MYLYLLLWMQVILVEIPILPWSMYKITQTLTLCKCHNISVPMGTLMNMFFGNLNTTKRLVNLELHYMWFHQLFTTKLIWCKINWFFIITFGFHHINVASRASVLSEMQHIHTIVERLKMTLCTRDSHLMKLCTVFW